MLVKTLLAVVPVRDVEVAAQWYERLLGRPADARPMPGLADWHLTDTGWFQLFHDPAKAGSTMVNLSVADIDAAAAELSARGVEPGETVDASQGVRLLPIRDPDGNTVTLIQNLRDS